MIVCLLEPCCSSAVLAARGQSAQGKVLVCPERVFLFLWKACGLQGLRWVCLMQVLAAPPVQTSLVPAVPLAPEAPE